jgi:hypothetical protein
MAIYDFSELESKFPEIVAMMNDPFDSHEFILALAQRNQVEYVRALHAYAAAQEKPAPFQAVHRAIIQSLARHPELVILIRENKSSTDIFGNSQTCGEWRKVQK